MEVAKDILAELWESLDEVWPEYLLKNRERIRVFKRTEFRL